MFGDVLRNNIAALSASTASKGGNCPFWRVLRDIAVADIKACAPVRVDSVNAIKIYYEILKSNEDLLPIELCEVLPSNKQERYRVQNRNMWSSNAFHPDGIANQPGIVTERKFNDTRRGERIIYQGVVQ